MYRGYVKLWRKTLDAGWLKQPNLCVFWIWCLLKASHKEMDVIVGYQTVHLMPGDFIFGRHKASEELEMGEQSIRTNLEFLKNAGNLTIKVTNKFSVISINNWSIYQDEENITNQQSNQQVTSNQPASNQQVTTNKNVKNVKNEKNKTYSVDFLSFYEAYPKKVGKDAAWKSWQNRNGSRPEVSFLIEAVERQKKSIQWIKDGGQYIPHPATWITQGRWEDKLEVELVKPVGRKPW